MNLPRFEAIFMMNIQGNKENGIKSLKQLILNESHNMFNELRPRKGCF